MIVKNEAHIITNTLSKLLDKIKIDYWVICDTGLRTPYISKYSWIVYNLLRLSLLIGL